MSNPDESSLIEQIRSGNQDALVQYIELKRHVLLAFIQKRLGTHLQKKVEPDDILQEVSVDAIRAFDKVNVGDHDPINWFFQLCERKIIDTHRKFFESQKRDAARETSFGDSDGEGGGGLANLLIASMTSPSAAFSRDQKQLKMLAALESLPEDQCEALRLRYLVGLPSKEIAAKLGKSDGAIRVMLSRGLNRLQQLMGEDV